MSKNIVANCGRCKMNIGDKDFPICKYEEIDEMNSYIGVSTKDMNSMYTEDCTRFNKK